MTRMDGHTATVKPESTHCIAPHHAHHTISQSHAIRLKRAIIPPAAVPATVAVVAAVVGAIAEDRTIIASHRSTITQGNPAQGNPRREHTNQSERRSINHKASDLLRW